MAGSHEVDGSIPSGSTLKGGHLANLLGVRFFYALSFIEASTDRLPRWNPLAFPLKVAFFSPIWNNAYVTNELNSRMTPWLTS